MPITVVPRHIGILHLDDLVSGDGMPDLKKENAHLVAVLGSLDKFL